MAVDVRFITDPACPWSWTVEPAVRKLMVEFGETLRWTWVMGGLARDYAQGYAGRRSEQADWGSGGAEGISQWLDALDEGRMPLDPRLLIESPIRSTYPACMGVKAAAEQAPDGGYAYLRALREGLFCFRRKLDTAEPLVEEARRVGLDGERFRRDLESNAIVEAFAADLDEARAVPGEARAQGRVEEAGGAERVSLPTAVFIGEDGSSSGVFGHQRYEDYRAAAEAAGARRAGDPPPGALQALRRFGRMAAREVELVCDLPEPRAALELWGLACEWRVRPVPVLSGYLWEPG